MATQAMRYGHVQHHMGYYPTHMSQDPLGYQVSLVPQSIRRPDRQRNRHQAHAQNVEAEAQAKPVINSTPMSSIDHSSSYHPDNPSLNSGEVGTSSQHLSQFDMFDLNTSMDYTNKANDDNENPANRRGRRQIRRPGCGTHRI
ncbi:hypothetical protein E3N88_38291 [Mikania micrantha]|uniref:Uncharacterized protein n=1 Tax=Mikania micrantha TaxID=192012 RepID=A0A5N6LTK4_9ASTR|nr:hypothetical protein E3N88_38291 [Mikania micrantha]